MIFIYNSLRVNERVKQLYKQPLIGIKDSRLNFDFANAIVERIFRNDTLYPMSKMRFQANKRLT